MKPPSCTLPADATLRKKSQYDTLRERGIMKRGSFFHRALLQLNPSESTMTRCGFIASSRVGNAVARNRAKRLLRELYRRERSRILSPSWMALIATPQITKATFAQLKEEWNRLLKKFPFLNIL